MTDSAHTIDAAGDAEPAARDEVPTRRCGRCRIAFAIPADTHPMELRDWWACADCADALLPGRQRTPVTRTGAETGPT